MPTAKVFHITIICNDRSNMRKLLISEYAKKARTVQRQITYFRLKYVVLCFLVFTNICFSQSAWNMINPSPAASSCSLLTAVTYGGGLYVGVGKSGTILTSPDATIWTERTSGTTADLWAIAFGDSLTSEHASLFVATGDSGIVLTSSDGKTWTDIGLPRNFFGIPIKMAIYGNGLFVIVSPYEICTSVDGIKWKATFTDSSNTYGVYLRGATFGNGQFAVVGDGIIVTSYDGLVWTRRTNPASLLAAVAYGNGKFVAVGINGWTVTSADGITWSTLYHSSTNINFGYIAHGHNTFMAGPGPALYLSGDSTWLEADVNLKWATYVNGQFIGSSGKHLLTSTDGVVWTNRNAGNDADLNSVTYGNNRFVAVGVGGATWSSSDGAAWEINIADTASNFSSVTYGDGRFVALDNNSTVHISSDGLSWTKISPITSNHLNSITYGKNVFVAAGGVVDSTGASLIYTSLDGSTWTLADSGMTYYLQTVVYLDNLFLATCFNGTILTSTAGSNWEKRDIGACVLSFAYGNGLFVAGCLGGVILTSSDAITWTKRNSEMESDIESLVFANNQFVAVGMRYQNQENIGEIYSSSDGTTWSPENTVKINGLKSVTIGNDRFVTVGRGGTILTSNADIPGIVSKTSHTTFAVNGIQINKTDHFFSVFIPNSPVYGRVNMTIFNVAGKKVYATIAPMRNGILCVPAGKYRMASILSLLLKGQRTSCHHHLCSRSEIPRHTILNLINDVGSDADH